MDIVLKRLYKGLADIRSDNVRKAYDLGDNIVVTVEGEKGVMTLTPQDLKNKVILVSKEFKSLFRGSKPYKLISYKWIPDNK